MARFAHMPNTRGVLLAMLLCALPAAAEEDVAGAANAFSRAQRAALAGDYAQAAELFELADSLAPTPEALRSALSARRAQGQLATAAGHAEELLRRYPDDSESRKLASDTLDEAKKKYARQEVSCSPEPCVLLIDGAAAGAEPKAKHVVYLPPGEHELVASFGKRRANPKRVTSVAGGRESSRFEAPPETTPEAPPVVATTSGDTDPGRDRPPESGGLSPWFFGIGVGVTAVLGGVTIWSGLDTLDKHDAYEQNQTQAGYDEGQRLERRTNILIGATAVAAAATITLAVFTDFGGSKTEARVGAGAIDGRPALVVQGAF